jgi:hypothetical protein
VSPQAEKKTSIASSIPVPPSTEFAKRAAPTDQRGPIWNCRLS